MSFLDSIFGSSANAAGEGAGAALEGIGKAAVNIRSAITGEVPPELQVKLAELDAQLALAQAKLNEIEAASGSFFKSGWRPAVGWLCVMGLFYSAILAPVMRLPLPENDILTTLLFSLLGLGSLRTLEKARGVTK